MSYCSSYVHTKNEIVVELDLSNHATKSDLNSAAGVDRSQFAKKNNLGNLKSGVDKLDTEELK